MSTFSNKSVISWPQKHATDASYRKPAATKRGCVSSYHQKKIHKPKQMWTTIVSRCLPQQREQIWFRKEMMQSTDLQIRNIPARPPTATKESKIKGEKKERADSITWAAQWALESLTVMMETFTDETTSTLTLSVVALQCGTCSIPTVSLRLLQADCTVQWEVSQIWSSVRYPNY